MFEYRSQLMHSEVGVGTPYREVYLAVMLYALGFPVEYLY